MPKIKITEKQRAEILKLYDQGTVRVSMLARLFGVSRAYIYKIVKQRHLDRKDKYKLTDQQVKEIREHYEMYTDSMRTIAKMYGVSHSQISNIINHKQRRGACKD